MNVMSKIRRGEGTFWGAIKRLAQATLQAHIPVGGPQKVIYRGLYGVHVAVREGCLWSARFWWYEPLFRSQCECVGYRFRMEQLPYLQGQGRLIVGNDVQLSGKPSFSFGRAGGTVPKIKIGNGTFIGHNVSIATAASVVIGDNCLVANSAMIRDYDGHPVDAADRRAGRRLIADEVRPVQIGDDVWIGAHAFILKGVTIGDRSVVAAGAIVTKDVPANVVVAGNPARIVRHLTLASGSGPATANAAVALPG